MSIKCSQNFLKGLCSVPYCPWSSFEARIIFQVDHLSIIHSVVICKRDYKNSNRLNSMEFNQSKASYRAWTHFGGLLVNFVGCSQKKNTRKAKLNSTVTLSRFTIIEDPLTKFSEDFSTDFLLLFRRIGEYPSESTTKEPLEKSQSRRTNHNQRSGQTVRDIFR